MALLPYLIYRLTSIDNIRVAYDYREQPFYMIYKLTIVTIANVAVFDCEVYNKVMRGDTTLYNFFYICNTLILK